jgi:hypothetical protein
MARGGELDVLFLLGADEIDIARWASLRRLHRHAWRQAGAPSRRRHPAGRDLHREVGHLRQHRGPRADDQRAVVPAGRGPRGLGDFARAVRRARPALPFDSLAASCAPRCTRRPHLMRHRRDRASVADVQGPRRTAKAAVPARRPSQCHSNFYLTNPIARASAVMARMLGPRGGTAAGGGVRWISPPRWTDLLPIWPVDRHRRRAADCCSSFCCLHRLHPAADRKIWAAVQIAPRPQRRRPLRPAAVVRRPLEVRAEGAGHPGRRRQGRLPAGAAGDLRSLALSGLGGDPRRPGWAIADINVGVLYIFAISSLGVYGIIMAGWASNSKYPSWRRCVRPRRWCPTKSRSASSSSPCCSASAR